MRLAAFTPPVQSIAKQPDRHAGFTLVEMAAVLLIVALLLGALLTPLSQQIEQRKISEAQKILDQIGDALMGFALSQTPPRLPCPDVAGPGGVGPADGIEDPLGTAGCFDSNSTSSWGGNIPWVTLGVPATDPWGQRYQYRVNGAFVGAITLTSAGSGAGVLRICSDATCATLVANNVPAVIYSSGSNGATQPPTSPDELENTSVAGHVNNDRTFVSRTYSSATGSEFDDIVVWLSSPILMSRLVTAQKLP